MNAKFHYDRKHQPCFLKVGDYALLRLHKGYSIPSAVSKKLDQQYVGPFRIIERIGKLAYKLDIPHDWRIHPVFTIAQIEPAPNPAEDPYERPRPDHPPPVEGTPGDTNELRSWELERTLNKRTVKKGRGLSIQYLVRWKGYGPEYDRWYSLKDLTNAKELIEDYEKELNSLTNFTPPIKGSPSC